MSKPECTYENREKLAKAVVDSMSLEDLVFDKVIDLCNLYQDDEGVFLSEWDSVFGEES